MMAMMMTRACRLTNKQTPGTRSPTRTSCGPGTQRAHLARADHGTHAARRHTCMEHARTQHHAGLWQVGIRHKHPVQDLYDCRHGCVCRCVHPHGRVRKCRKRHPVCHPVARRRLQPMVRAVWVTWPKIPSLSSIRKSDGIYVSVSVCLSDLAGLATPLYPPLIYSLLYILSFFLSGK